MADVQTQDRRDWLSLLARSPEGKAEKLMEEGGFAPAFSWLRSPETGTVMVEGKSGGSGAPFNLGEVTVTRCSLRLESGEVGHGYVQGRSKSKARAAAQIDALMQGTEAARVEEIILTPLRRDDAMRKAERAEKAAATKVEFFTMVRGED